MCTPASGPLPRRLCVGSAHRVRKIIAEMGANVVDDCSDLLVVQQVAEGRHALASMDDKESWRHVRCAPDSRRLAASPKLAESRANCGRPLPIAPLFDFPLA